MNKLKHYAFMLIALLPLLARGQSLQLYVNGVVTVDNQRLESLSPTQLQVTCIPLGTTPPTGTYQWLKNEQPVPSTGAYYYINSAGVYRLRFNGNQLSNCIIVNSGSTADSRNYTVSDQARYAGIKETQELSQSYGFNKQVTYFDGFSRPLQQIAVNSTASTAKDLVQPYEYGPQGEQTKSYLPYASGKDGNFKTTWQSDQNAFYQSSPKIGRPGTNGPTYAEVVTDDDPLGRSSEKASPGEPWKKGGGHTQATVQRSNTTNDNVRLWTYTPATGLGATGTLALGATAVPNTLIVAVVRDEDNKWGISFTNEKGLLICRRTYLSGIPELPSSSDSYLETDYTYDMAGHLLATIPPKAVALLIANPALATATFQNQYLFLTQYDVLSRAVAQKVPGKGWTFTVYDRWDRIAATQDQNQYDRGVWSFIKYDALNRAVMTGEVYDSSDPATLANTLQTWPVGKRSEHREDNETGYSLNVTFPDAISANEVATVLYYDDYDYYPLKATQRPDLSFVPENGYSAASTQTRGFRTGERKRILSGTYNYQWLTSVVYYDQYGRVAQELEDNFTRDASGTVPGVDRTTIQRLFAGQPYITLLTHNRYNDSGGKESHTTDIEHDYDENGHLINTYESIDEAPFVVLQTVEYNDLGQIVDKKLGYDYANSNYIQSLDYRYNIRGWLTNINNRNLSNNEWLDNTTPNSDTEPADAFGLELKYEAGSTAPGCYNGNISAAIWNTNTVKGRMRQYAYTYDNDNRLKSGQYGALNYANGQYSFTAEQNDARGEGIYTLSGIEYDLNGNITALARAGLLARNTSTGAAVYGRIDDLTISHDGNQLSTVTDLAAASAATNDFENGPTIGATYVYDKNGNLTYDPNKKASFYYNQFNLPWLIYFDNGNEIYTLYTSTGEKASTTYYTYSPTVGYTSKTVQFIQGFTYSTSAQEPLTVNTPTGRAQFEAAATATSPSAWAHEYHIRDHQGSLRLVLKQDPVLSYRLTMESAYASEEEAQFKRVAETRQLDASHARTGYYSARLNAHQVDRSNGPATTMQVAAGDSVHLEVFGLYDKGGLAPSFGKVVTPVLAVSGSLGAISTSGPDNQATSQRRWIPSITAGVAVAWDKLHALFDKRQEIPQASFTYELYNKDSVLVKSATGLLSETGQPEWQQLQHGFRAKEAGYVKVYLANASGTNAWFDDMILNRFPVPTTQENHYDPFGQNLEEIEIASSFDSKQQYTGKEKVNDFGLEWTDFGSRFYDSQLGQWHSIDPMNQYNSPYVAMGDNHVNNVDPNGQFAWLLAAISGGFLNVGMNANNIHSFGQGLSYFATGAAAAVAGAGIGSGVNSALGGGGFWAGVTQSSSAHYTTGFIAGSLSGAAAGLTGGFIGGLGNAASGGASFNDSFKSGLSGGLNGGISGGVMGGIYGFADAAFRGRNPLTGNAINYTLGEQFLASTAGTVNPEYEDFTVWNRDNSDVFYKPEDGAYGMSNRIRPGQAINDPVDGVATSLHRDQVFKIPGKGVYRPSATIYQGGHVSLEFTKTSAAALTFKYGSEYIMNGQVYHYGWMTGQQLDPSWYPLFYKAFIIR